MTTEPYPTIRVWTVGSAALVATLTAVQRPGRKGVEGGVFWVGRREPLSVVHAVVVPTGDGVVEAPGFWRVTPEVFGTISSWAALREWSLLGICHIHGDGVPAQLSEQDRKHLVRAPGVLAVVIGSAGRVDDPNQWGWYLFDKGSYRELPQEERTRRLRLGGRADAEVWSADRSGCRRAVA